MFYALLHLITRGAITLEVTLMLMLGFVATDGLFSNPFTVKYFLQVFQVLDYI